MSSVQHEIDADEFARTILSGFAPPDSVTVDEWAENDRIIAVGNSEPGRWSNTRAPYLVEPMRDVSDDALHTIIISGCSQSGKTELGQNIVGHSVCHDVCTAIWAGPNDAAAETASVRFDAMVQSTPALRDKFGTRTARSQVNNLGLKEYIGGKIVFASAGSPSSLASHPARLVIGDEIDRWPLSLRKEGDPVAIIRARTTTFARGKAVFLSSPTQEGASRIEALAVEGDLREWNWKCSCGDEHVPDWANVQWPPGKSDVACYVMPCCGLACDDGERWRAMARGRWVPTREGQPGIRSYRFRGLSSPWLKLALLASEAEQAKGNPRKEAPFWNTRLGLPYEAGAGEGVDAEAVKALAEDYRTDVCPRNAALIVAGIDVQGGWIVVLIAAVGEADEMWALQWHEVQGDIKDPATRAKVDELLEQRFKHPAGEFLTVEAIAADSGYETQSVLEWSQHQRAKGRKFFATKGAPGWQRAIWERGGDITRSAARFFLVGVDQGKQQVLASLACPENGAAKIHTPIAFEQHAPHFWQWATAEELVTKETAGGDKKEWRMRKGQRRNEALDCLVLALAVSHSADFQISQRLARLHAHGSIKPQRKTMAELAEIMAAFTQPAN